LRGCKIVKTGRGLKHEHDLALSHSGKRVGRGRLQVWSSAMATGGATEDAGEGRSQPSTRITLYWDACLVWSRRTLHSIFYSARNEAAAKAKGVKRVCIPNRSTKSLERKREQKKRWFRNGQKWRTGCEGRISVVKRRRGLSRCRYKGSVGMDRWVGLGVVADNLINIGRAMEHAAEP